MAATKALVLSAAALSLGAASSSNATTTTTNAQIYDEARAARAVDFAGAAYCAGTLGQGVQDWDCHVCKSYPGVNASVFEKGGLFSTDQNGFVAFDPNDGTDGSIVVSFAGTDPLKIAEWIDDFDTVKVEYPFCEGCEVHKGFYDNWKSVEDDVMVLVAGFATDHPDAPIRVLGHSLGAAVAVHAAIHMASAETDGGGGYGARVAPTYTFGEPRVGNNAFNAFVTASLAASGGHTRVTHRRDPVPHLPPMSFGFTHPATEVFYAGASDGDWVVCDGSGEDPTCSNQYDLDIDVVDHLFYVGFDFTTNYLGCKL